MEDKIGSLAEGKQADIVVIDGTTPAMCCVFDYDPLVALVRHAGVQEVETVIVAGSILKEGGRLADVSFNGPETWEGRDRVVETLDSHGRLTWKTVAEQLRSTRSEIQKRIDGCDMEVAKHKILKLWGSDDASKVLV